MEIPTRQNHVYTLTCDNACDVYDVDTGTLIHQHHAGEVQSQFTAIGMKSETTDDTAILTELFNGATAGNGSGGGYIESDLNVGHGAADAVAAVCTLTLGDLATGGTLTDSNGQAVELENPHKYAVGTVSIPDATAAGTIAFGEHEAIEFEAKAAANATGYWPLEAGSYASPPIELRRLADPENPAGEYEVLWEDNGGFSTAEEFIAAFNSEQDAAEAEISELEDTPFLITAKGDYAGAEGNRLVLANDSGGIYVTQLSGGQDARTPQEVVDALNASEDCPTVAILDADELGIGFTAKEYGVNDTITITGDLFSDAAGMSGGHGDYTYAEVIAAINGDDGEGEPTYPMGVKAEATLVEVGQITLTSRTAGKAANAIVYTSTGCFGGETVKQGSTTRGKDAVEQTAFKIFLNGEVLDVEPAPTPEELEEDTAMKNHGVYLVTADATAQDFTGITLADNATAEIWLTCTSDDNSVALPGSTEGWIWLDAMPDMEAGKTYAVAARNVGNAVLARPIYEYTTPAES